jgi:hypothetical protein
MNKTLLTIGLIAAVAVAACAGDPPQQLLMPIPDTPDDQEQTEEELPTGAAFDYFKANVNDLLVQECATCHDQGGTAGLPWMDTTDIQTNYNMMRVYGNIVTPPDCSQLILKSLGTHSGPSLSPAADKEVRLWLTLEATEQSLVCENAGTEPTVDSCEAMLDAFQGCMHLAHWDGVGMDNVPNQQTEGDGPCYGCHSQGVGSAFLNQDSDLSFEAHKTDRYFLQKLVGCSYSNGQVVGVVPTDRYLNKGTEPCAQQPCHPDYLLSTLRQQAIADYVQEVQDAIAGGTCDDLANYAPL